MAKEWRKTRSSSFRWNPRKAVPPERETTGISFLAFEISALMSKLVQLWNQLEDGEFTRVKQHLSNSTGIKKLISDDDQFLTELFLNEIVQDLQYIARSIARFATKCSDPVLHEFEKFVRDPAKNHFDWFGWQYRWKKMERRVKKMQRFVVFTAELSREMEILAEVERDLKRTTAIFAFGGGGGGKSFKFRKKVKWHRRHVQSLKLVTPWNRGFDYILRLFMRSIITVVERIKIVFGVKEIRRPPSVECEKSAAAQRLASGEFNEIVFGLKNFLSLPAEPPLMKLADVKSPIISEGKKISQFTHLSFRDCKGGGNGSPPQDGRRIRKTSSLNLENRVENRASSPSRINGGHFSISSFFSRENISTPPPSSLAGAGLSIHYGKIVILIEKLASAPHLIGAEDRDELFNMLPATIRMALRSRLRSAAKVWPSSLYDPVVAAEWKSAVAKILQWLAPMAHDMETWDSEQSFEKPLAGESRSHVLLLQTLHYADREKTEAAIVELLVAFTNICSSSEVCEKRFSNPLGV